MLVLAGGISEAVTLTSQEQIATHFTKQKDNFVEFINDSSMDMPLKASMLILSIMSLGLKRIIMSALFPFD